MERGLFQIIQGAVRPLRRRRVRGQRFTDADIVLIALWAALHDRPILWACRACNWPPSRRPRRLPDQSTMSRRLRSEPVGTLLALVLLAIAHAGFTPSVCAVLDGRAFAVSPYSRDRHALRGRGRGRYERGYRLHALIDAASGRLLAHLMTPLNVAESVAARLLLSRARAQGLLADGALVLADANYDSNPLHRHAAGLGVRLLAPRRTPGAGFAKTVKGGLQHINRMVSVVATEVCRDLGRRISSKRGGIERQFSRQTCTGGGLRELPSWVRSMPRVRLWASLKLIIQGLKDALKALDQQPNLA